MEIVSLQAADATFDFDADAFAHFSLAEEASGATAMVYTVSIKDVEALKTALGTWLTTATDSNAKNTQTYMHDYLVGEINAIINSTNASTAGANPGDDIGAALQASSVSLTFDSFQTDAEAGADNLIVALEASQPDKNRIGLQFPTARYPATFSADLPAESGDSLTFQFEINSTITVSDDPKDQAAPTAGDNGNPTVGTKLNVTRSRRVNIVVTKQ